MSLENLPNIRLDGRRRRAAALVLVAGIFVCAAGMLALRAVPAGAVILPAQTIDGPSEEIVGFGGVAMAEDGSGGLVYLKRVDGVPHVFVSRYLEGKWLPPIRVDTGQPYAASWPRIGAATGGELIVVWATPFATDKEKPLYEMLGSVLGAGGSTFGQPIIVDGDIEEASGTSPDLAVSSTGQADIVYRVVDTSVSTVPLLRPGDVVEQVRVAHFDGERWTNLGAINRNSGASMRPPTQANAPRIAIGPTGNAVVVWQEPDVEGVARIWARRIFGSSLDYVMPVSATSFHGVPISEDADAPAVAFSQLGQAEVAYRQPAGVASPLPGPRIFLNILPDGESVGGQEFQGATAIDENAVSGGKAAVVGPPSIDLDEQRSMRMLYDSNGMPRVIEAGDRGLSGALSLGPPFAGAEPFAVSVMDPEGGGVSAWPSEEDGHAAVAVREDFPDGAVQTALVSGGAGGEVGELAVGRSGLGDGLIAFRQGPFGDAAIVAAQATAPPEPSLLTAPKGWVKPAQAVVSWQPAVSANGPLRYSVVLDGRVEPTSAGVLTARINPRGLSSGRHTVQILATDMDGQSTLSAPVSLQITGVPPGVKISRARGGATVSVRVSDRYVGVDVRAVSVSFGDGSSAHGRAYFNHRYAHAGLYRVVVSARDKLGNAGVVSQWVSVR